MSVKRLVVGVTGASGAIYARSLVHVIYGYTALKEWEAHVIISKAGIQTIKHESQLVGSSGSGWVSAITEEAAGHYGNHEIGAAPASGSWACEGMVIAPCSSNTLAHIAHGFQDTLITRAAAVQLKERRPLVLVHRETPLSLADARNIVAVTEQGATVMPPVPAWYTIPQSLADLYYHTVGRILDQFGIDAQIVDRWDGVRTS